MMATPMAFRLDDDIRQRLGQLAAATHRPMSYLAAEALRQYLDNNEWQIRAIQEGIQDADAGRLIEHEALISKWEQRRAAVMD
jgi:RHH-type rel operon transcriptional repressor/antitoxin RelB